MIVFGVPIMVLLPLACLGMPIDGIGYLAGFGDEVTVTVTKSSDGYFSDQLGSDDVGIGYYRHEGKRVAVKLWGVDKGETVDARLAVTSTFGKPGEPAYASWWAALLEASIGGAFMIGAFMIGRTLFTMGREAKS